MHSQKVGNISHSLELFSNIFPVFGNGFGIFLHVLHDSRYFDQKRENLIKWIISFLMNGLIYCQVIL